MKEQKLSAIKTSTLPKNLRHLVSAMPDATWNGYNVWANSDDPERMKSLGITLANNGKHVGQWFTSEKAQESLAKRNAKKAQKAAKEAKKESQNPKAPEPKPQAPEPKAVPEPPKSQEIPPAPKPPQEFCCIAEGDYVKNGKTIRLVNLTRVKNCTPEEFAAHLKKQKHVTNTSMRVVKNYPTDGIFMSAVKHMKEFKDVDMCKRVVECDMESYLRATGYAESLKKTA